MLLGIGGLALLALLAVWAARSRPLPRQPHMSVLLITIDTLRADALGTHGGGPTPWMDRLAKSGVRFDDAHAHNVLTLPSHANILSGRHPQDHGVRDNSGFRFPARLDTLATLLSAQGYRTGAFVSAFPLDSRFGLDRGFQVYEDGLTGAETAPAFVVQERPGEQTVALAREWLRAQAGQRSFCWVHLYEPHFPYQPPEPLARRFASDPYRGEVAAADAALRPLLEPLLDDAQASPTLVVLTSDHGESLGEHGEATHGIFAYEATLKVPLVLYQPALLRPRVVAQPVSHVDLLPTILDALGLAVPEGLPGRSLLPLAAGTKAVPGTTYFEALSGPLHRGWAPLHGLIGDGMKYIDLPIPELYDLRRDPGERDNQAAARPDLVQAMRSRLLPLRSQDPGPAAGEESAETRERLRSLGYLVASVPPGQRRYTEEDDPKRLIGLDALLQDVAARYLAGDLAGARERCREVVRRRPGMALALLQLAHLERANGDLPAALEALRQAVALNPEDATAVSLLGGYLTQAGRAREAATLLQAYSRRPQPDTDVLMAYGLALGRLARFAEAEAALARARTMDPSNALVLVHLGTVQLMGGQRAAARQSFGAALLAQPRLSRAHSSLAFMDAEEGRLAEGLARWREAVRFDRRECSKLPALLSLLRQRGGLDQAPAYLQACTPARPASAPG